MTYKSRVSALKAARQACGEAAREGFEFNLRHSGAGWLFELVPAANDSAAEAQAQRKRGRPPKAQPQAKAEPRSFGQRETLEPALTKTELLAAMMRRPEGATSKQMEQATGWVGESVRGLIGALKRKGVRVVSTKDPGQPTVYRIAPERQAAPVVDDIGDVI